MGRRAPTARAAIALAEMRVYGRTTASAAASQSAISSSGTYRSFQRIRSRTGLFSRIRTSGRAARNTSPTIAIRAPVSATIRGAAERSTSTPL